MISRMATLEVQIGESMETILTNTMRWKRLVIRSIGIQQRQLEAKESIFNRSRNRPNMRQILFKKTRFHNHKILISKIVLSKAKVSQMRQTRAQLTSGSTAHLVSSRMLLIGIARWTSKIIWDPSYHLREQITGFIWSQKVSKCSVLDKREWKLPKIYHSWNRELRICKKWRRLKKRKHDFIRSR